MIVAVSSIVALATVASAPVSSAPVEYEHPTAPHELIIDVSGAVQIAGNGDLYRAAFSGSGWRAPAMMPLRPPDR